jgi:hypothetical protein
MKRRICISRVLCFLIAFLAFSLFLSCGFEPAWKSQDTTVSFRLGPAARAMASGGGYLYVRPLGGPLGTGPKPYLGPIELGAGDTFTTTEIAPGSYDGFVLIYSPEPIDDVTYAPNGINHLVRDDLSASDDDVTFTFFSTDNLDLPHIYDSVLQGAGSGANVGPMEVIEHTVNELQAVLMPFVAMPKVFFVDSGEPYTLFGSPGAGSRHRYYLRIDALSSLFEEAAGYYRCSIEGVDDVTLRVNSLKMFRGDAKTHPLYILSQDDMHVTLSDNVYYPRGTPSSPGTFYLYVDITVVGEGYAEMSFMGPAI